MKSRIFHRIRIAAVLVCFVCTAILPLFPELAVHASDAVGGTYGELTWHIDNDVLTISGAGSMEDDVTYPWTGCHYQSIQIEEGITTIGCKAFANATSVQAVTLPSTLTEIHAYAFRKTLLTELILPENIHVIEEGAFQDCFMLKNVDMQCTLTEIAAHLFEITEEVSSYPRRKMQITLPESVTSIGDYAFANHRLANENDTFPLPDQLQTVGSYAFAHAYYTVVLPDSVSSIYDSSFYFAETLTLGAGLTQILPSAEGFTLMDSQIDKIYVSKENSAFSSSDDGIALYNKEKTILYAVFQRLALENNTFTIPKTVTALGNPIYARNIENFAVEEENPAFTTVDGILTSLDGKTLVQYPAGRNGEGTTIEILDAFTVIGEGAFSHSIAENLILPDTIEEIDDEAFAYSSLKNAALGNRLWRIGNRAFYQTQISDIRIPASVIEIGSQAFGGESFLSLQFDHSAGVEILSFAADLSDCDVFYGKAGSPVEQLFPEKFRLKADDGKKYCGKDLSWNILSGVLYIEGSGAMDDSSFPWAEQNYVSVVFSGTNIAIAPRAFFEQKSLYAVDLTGVVSIGNAAFSGCSHLRTITHSDSVTMIESGAFHNTEWKNSAACYDGENRGYASLGTVLLWVNPAAETITIPETISYVSEQAFTKGNVHTLYLPKTPVVFHNNAFYDNATLEHVRYTENETDIPAAAYQKQAENIREITIYDEKGQLTKAFGFSKENTLLSLANAAYSSPYLKTLTDGCYAEILQEIGCTRGDSDQRLTEMIYQTITNRTTYGFVYGEDTCGETSGADCQWSLNQHTAYNITGPLLTGYGVCAAYTNCITDMIMVMQEKGFTNTLKTQRMGSDDHVWNAVGLDTGTHDEAWYYVDATNGLCLIGYENQVLKDYADMFHYDADLQKNGDGTYSVSSSTGDEIRLQGSDRSSFLCTGDLNGNGSVDIFDAYHALMISSYLSAGTDVSEIPSALLSSADVDLDGNVSMTDAYYILLYSSYAYLGEIVSWDTVLS